MLARASIAILQVQSTNNTLLMVNSSNAAGTPVATQTQELLNATAPTSVAAGFSPPDTVIYVSEGGAAMGGACVAGRIQGMAQHARLPSGMFPRARECRIHPHDPRPILSCRTTTTPPSWAPPRA